MGNVLSDETDDNQYTNNNNNTNNDDRPFLEEGFNLEAPDADEKINYGTAAPVWQNKKSTSDRSLSSSLQSTTTNTNDAATTTTSTGSNETQSQRQQQSSSEGQEVVVDDTNKASSTATTTSSSDQAAAAANNKKLSYIQMAKLGYQELINAIIRPPRADYKMEALGPPAFNFCNKRFTRTDFTLRTKRGYNLECSHWEPVDRVVDRIPVVIYMHGNSSARLEVIPQLSYLLSLGVAVFSFDFAGSGKSDGEYVSLGYYEREDLSCIVAHLRSTNVVSTIALWGRSMGAATALMFGDRDPSIACMILDSPFADLTQLCEEMVEKAREQGVIVPGIVVSLAIRLIQSSVKKQAGFNIKNISPIAHADKCFIPVLFVAGEHDDFIKKHHSELLHAKYAGDKNLIIVDGDHNSPRPKFLFDSATIFLQTCMQIPNDWALSVPISMNLMCPPWFYDIYEQRAAVRKRQQLQQAAVTQAQQQKQTTATVSNGNKNNNQNNTSSSAFTVEVGVPILQPPPSAFALSASSSTAKQQQEQQQQSSAAQEETIIPTDQQQQSNSSSSSIDPMTITNGYDHEEMGMTTERQRIIQASLFKMLGQTDTNDGNNNNSNNK